MSDTKLRPEDLTSEERAFNKLTPTQTELLALLSEECGEVVQVIGKILRHGLESCHPNGGPTNRELLAEEIGDCLCASRLLASAGMLNMASVEDRSAAKMEKVFRYLHHARRALFASAPEKAAKVSAFPVGNCVVCGELVAPYNKHAKYEGGYTCQRPQPAPPEPAAREMECGTADDDGPPDLDEIKQKARQEGFDDGYLAGRTYERNLAQPSRAAILPHGTKEGIWQK